MNIFHFRPGRRETAIDAASGTGMVISQSVDETINGFFFSLSSFYGMLPHRELHGPRAIAEYPNNLSNLRRKDNSEPCALSPPGGQPAKGHRSHRESLPGLNHNREAGQVVVSSETSLIVRCLYLKIDYWLRPGFSIPSRFLRPISAGSLRPADGNGT